MEAARNLFANSTVTIRELATASAPSAVGEVFFQRLLPGGDYVPRVTKLARGEPVLTSACGLCQRLAADRAERHRHDAAADAWRRSGLSWRTADDAG